MQQPVNAFWFRRDLRLHDNAGLYHALRSGLPLIAVFIFDKTILDRLESKQDARVDFIHREVGRIKQELREAGSDLVVLYDTPLAAWRELFSRYNIRNIYSNRDYEQEALTRDREIAALAAASGAGFHTYKDQCIFEGGEILKSDGTPYTVFTPYSKSWKARLNSFYLKPYPTIKYADAFHRFTAPEMPTLGELGFEPSTIVVPEIQVEDSLIRAYHQTRDFPAKRGTSRIGIHLRFGTISIRQWANRARQLNETFLNELIWRDFYMMILQHFSHVAAGKSFKPLYDRIPWRNEANEFSRWCEGKTGYPIVDAGMRELNATGYMHNRVRMITASFLTKHLLIDWRWGEAYFAAKLLDFEFSSNNGGWQWAAGSGTDAAPYFRVFNPTLQEEKFDPDREYIRKWVPEIGTAAYPAPMVDHTFARNRCLQAYKAVLSA